MCTRMKFNFKSQQCGKRKEKPSRTVLIQMAAMHSKLGISLPYFIHYTYRLWTMIIDGQDISYTTWSRCNPTNICIFFPSIIINWKWILDRTLAWPVLDTSMEYLATSPLYNRPWQIQTEWALQTSSATLVPKILIHLYNKFLYNAILNIT
jgi:hypothetical protein